MANLVIKNPGPIRESDRGIKKERPARDKIIITTKEKKKKSIMRRSVKLYRIDPNDFYRNEDLEEILRTNLKKEEDTVLLQNKQNNWIYQVKKEKFDKSEDNFFKYKYITLSLYDDTNTKEPKSYEIMRYTGKKNAYPSFTELAEKINDRIRTREAQSPIYGDLSDYLHTNYATILKEGLEAEIEGIKVVFKQWPSEYDKAIYAEIDPDNKNGFSKWRGNIMEQPSNLEDAIREYKEYLKIIERNRS